MQAIGGINVFFIFVEFVIIFCMTDHLKTYNELGLWGGFLIFFLFLQLIINIAACTTED